MDYTQNHRLPQWEKSDRVMMDDFNQAMANIETGFNSAGEDLDAMWSRFLDRLSPMACDVYHAVLRHSDQTDFNSSWRELHFNTFPNDNAVYDRTGLNWKSGALYLGAGSGWTVSQIVPKFVDDGVGRYSTTGGYHYTASGSFVSPGCGMLNSIRCGFYVDYNTNTYPQFTAQFKLTCKRKKNGQFLVVKECPLTLTWTTREWKSVDYSIDLPLLGGAEYQLVLDWVSGGSGNYKYALVNQPSTDFIPTVTVSVPTQGSFREQVTTPDSYERAIALVRYSGGNVTMRLGGVDMPLVNNFHVSLEDGTACREAQFMLPKGQIGTVTAELSANCPSGSMSIYDAGFVFI